MPRLSAPALLCLALAACAQTPDLGRDPAALAAGSPAPVILPLDTLIATAETGGITPAVGDSVAARAASLRARAAALRGPITDPETRDRLDAAIGGGT